MSLNTDTSIILHRAPWVVPVVSPAIEDGGVVVANGQILQVGKFTELKKGLDAVIKEHPEHLLIPALVNAHTHLELSLFAELGGATKGFSPAGDITAWIRKLINLRKGFNPAAGKEMIAAEAAAKGLKDSGIGIVADIGNLLPASNLAAEGLIENRFFLEFLGLSKQAEKDAFYRLETTSGEIACTAHAPHSTARGLIISLKNRARARGGLFPIHVAESTAELEFLMTGKGPFRELHSELGGWDGTFTMPGTGAVDYLDRLGVLDEKTLCVHCVHLTSKEIDLLAKRKAKVCLCPGSNRYLGVGKAYLNKFIERGLLPALGTDSLASNQRLSIWREMAILREDHPDVLPETIFRMATLAGAEGLGYEQILGALAPGKKATFLAVSCPKDQGKDIFAYLASRKEDPSCYWIE